MPIGIKDKGVAKLKKLLEETAHVDPKTREFMTLGRRPHLFSKRGPSGESMFLDGTLDGRELKEIQKVVHDAYNRMAPSGLYVVLSGLTGNPATGPHNYPQEAAALVDRMIYDITVDAT